VLSSAVAKKKRSRLPVTVPVRVLKPVLKPIIEPIIEPVVIRLDKHEELLLEVKSALNVQFTRIAALQAQMDHLLATLRNRS
jgi:hypothetical protein